MQRLARVFAGALLAPFAVGFLSNADLALAQQDPAAQPQRSSAYQDRKREMNEDVVTIISSGTSSPFTIFAEDMQNVLDQPNNPGALRVLPILGRGGDQLFILTGIPEGISLNPGGFFGKFWAVNSKVMSALTLTAPEGYSGSFTVSIVRRREGAASTTAASFKVTIREGATTATAATTATSEPAAPAAPATAAVAAATPAPASEPAKAARKTNPNEAAYMARAKTLLDSGDVSGARAIFETLALQGSAAGAMAMGETYDPVILRTMVVKGLEPDPEKARKWYLKAEALGGPDARSRLNELARR
jgi:hypothetical protein